ncbi:hypothetical protein CVT24_002334 [Panaeolus cyanescens]|uniref:Uncharacterized protein n=1 Tax=Panaeolus cyanescens TaxID=181874 RepID=A0A409YIN6_9AGAR|nr:hypothetical protein CVT24_002334 [Panaeolus cyanescens]
MSKQSLPIDTSKDDIARTSALEVARTIWIAHDLPESFLKNLVLSSNNPDLEVPSSFRLGLAAQSAVALSGLSAAYLHFLRTGEEQTVTVDARHASLSFHSEAWYTLDGQLPPPSWDDIAGLYKTKDDRWSLRKVTKDDVSSAFAELDSLEFEQKCLRSFLPVCAFIMRTREEWIETGHGKSLLEEYRQMGASAPVEIRKISDSAPRRFASQVENEMKYPLDGVRVLDLSRVLAGPVAGRTLAAHGAQTLLVTSPKLPALPSLDVETTLGKRTTQLDLTRAEHCSTLRELTGKADVFLQAYRPGALEKKGFGMQDILNYKASQGYAGNLVYAQLSAWGFNGPWRDRRGFDSLVQTATGFNADEGLAYTQSVHDHNASTPRVTPRPFPMQALDHAAGYVLAFGVSAALCHQITRGGSYEVRVSLAAVAEWVRSLGRLSPQDAFVKARPFPQPRNKEIQALSVNWLERHVSPGHGSISENTSNTRRRMTALRHAAILSKTPVREGSVNDPSTTEIWGAPMRLDVDDPVLCILTADLTMDTLLRTETFRTVVGSEGNCFMDVVLFVKSLIIHFVVLVDTDPERQPLLKSKAYAIRKQSSNSGPYFLLCGILLFAFIMSLPFGAFLNNFYNGQMYYDRLARRWKAEEKRHDNQRIAWDDARREYENDRERWNRDKEEHRADMERWAKQKAEEDRKRAAISWQALIPADQCLRYNSREYTSTLSNVPLAYDAREECAEKPAYLNGRWVKPTYCSQDAQCGSVTGHWITTDNEPSCQTVWAGPWDKGCQSPGVRHYHTALENIPGWKNWPVMCMTTPGITINGVFYQSPSKCEFWDRKVWGVWFVHDSSCR